MKPQSHIDSPTDPRAPLVKEVADRIAIAAMKAKIPPIHEKQREIMAEFLMDHLVIKAKGIPDLEIPVQRITREDHSKFPTHVATEPFVETLVPEPDTRDSGYFKGVLKSQEQRVVPDVTTDDQICPTCNGETSVCHLCNRPASNCPHFPKQYAPVVCPECRGTGEGID